MNCFQGNRIKQLVTGLCLLSLVGCGSGLQDASEDDRGARWRDAALLETGMADVLQTKAVSDKDGNVTIAWLQSNQVKRTPLWVNRYNVSGEHKGWQTMQMLIDAEVEVFDMVADTQGNVTLVWARRTEDPQILSLQARRFEGGQWGEDVAIGHARLPAIIDGASEIYRTLPIALVADSAGRVTVAWLHRSAYGADSPDYAPAAPKTVDQILSELGGATWGTVTVPQGEQVDAVTFTPGTGLSAGALLYYDALLGGDTGGAGAGSELLTRNIVRVNQFIPESGWGESSTLIGGLENVLSFQLLLDNNDAVTLVWRQQDVTSNPYRRVVIMAPTTAASASGPVGTLVPLQVSLMLNSVDVNFNVSAQYSAANLSARRMTVDGGIEAAKKLEIVVMKADATTQLADIHDSKEIRVALDREPNVTNVVWTKYSDETESVNLYANYNLSGNWLVNDKGPVPALVESEDGYVVDPAIVVDTSGTATVIWRQQDDSDRWNLWVNRRSRLSNWDASKAQLLEDDDRGDVVGATIIVDDDDNVTVAWRQHDGVRYNVHARQIRDGTWGKVATLELDSRDSVYGGPMLTMNGKNRISALWVQHDGVRSRPVQAFNKNGNWSKARIIDEKGNYSVVMKSFYSNLDQQVEPFISQFSLQGNRWSTIWMGYDGVTANLLASEYR